MRKYFIHEKTHADAKTCTITRFAPLAGNVADETLGLGYARYACNVKIKNGKISRASGVEYARKDTLLVPSGIIVGKTIKDAIIYQRYDHANKVNDDRLIVVFDDERVYEWKEDEGTFIELVLPPTNEISLLNYQYKGKDVLLAFSKEGDISMYDGEEITTQKGPCITDACVYNERIYGVISGESGKLRHSSNNSPFGWNDITTGAGTIEFSDEGGALRRVITCGDSLYVFRDYAVHRLVCGKDASDYTLTKIYFTNNPIYHDTVACWNGIVYFMANDGFNKIDGSRVSTVWADEFSMIEDKTYAQATCYDGKYYVTAKFVTDEGQVGCESSCNINNGVMGIYIGSGGGVELIRGVDVKKFVPCFWGGKSYLYLINSPGIRAMSMSMFNDEGTQYGTYPEMRWTSPQVILGKKGEDVTVRRVSLRARNQVEMQVRLYSDHNLVFNGSIDVQTKTLNRRGQTLQIHIRSSAPDMGLRGFEIEYETTERFLHNSNLV